MPSVLSETRRKWRMRSAMVWASTSSDQTVLANICNSSAVIRDMSSVCVCVPSLVAGQVPVGGRVGDEGQPHGEGRLGQRLGHAAVAGAHHADDRVLRQARVAVLSRYQAPGVLQGADRLVTGGISISSLYLNLT